MEKPILKIMAKKYSGESTVMSVRLPKDMLRDIDDAASSSGRTRNEMVTICLEFALKHLEIVSDGHLGQEKDGGD